MSSSDKDKMPRVGLRLASEILAEVSGGDVDKEIAVQLAETVQACQNSGKKGKVVLTINVAPGPKMIGLSVDVKATKPRPTLEAALMYTDEKGSLFVENPRQGKLFDGPKVVNPTNGGEN